MPLNHKEALTENPVRKHCEVNLFVCCGFTRDTCVSPQNMLVLWTIWADSEFSSQTKSLVVQIRTGLQQWEKAVLCSHVWHFQCLPATWNILTNEGYFERYCGKQSVKKWPEKIKPCKINKIRASLNYSCKTQSLPLHQVYFKEFIDSLYTVNLYI